MQTIQDAARCGRWLEARRLRHYPAIFLLFYIAAAGWALSGMGPLDPMGRPLGTDFLSFWSVSSLMQEGRAFLAYDPQSLHAVQQEALGAGVPYYGWLYPPVALLIVAPLALLPYGLSLAAWLAATLGAYLAVLRRIVPRGETLWLAATFPAVFVTFGHGQNALLTTALMGAWLLLLPGRPALAGAVLAILIYKPQFGLLIPFALLAGGHWRTFIAATAAALALIALSAGLFGMESWQNFLQAGGLSRRVIEEGLVEPFKMQSTFAAMRLAGGGIAAAYAAQAVASAGALAIVAWAWSRRVPHGRKAAMLVAAAPLATPFVLDYDLVLLALPLAWLAREGLKGGFLPWEKTLMALLWAWPLFARPLAQHTHLMLTPLLLVLLIGLLARRIRLAAPASAASSPAR